MDNNIKVLNKVLNILKNIYFTNNNISKEKMKNFLIEKNIIKKYSGSLYIINGTNILLVFSDNSKGFSNTILSLKKIIKYEEEFFILNISLQETDFNLKCINLPFIKKISHSSSQLSFGKIVGSFNYPNIYKEKDNINNTKNNIENIYRYYLDNIKNKEIYIKDIVNNTHNIVGRKRIKTILSKDDILNISKMHIGLNKNLKLIENKILKTYINGKENKIKEIFDKEHGSKIRGTLIEELIVGENTKNDFEDLYMEYKGKKLKYHLYINIKTSNFLEHKTSGPTGFNIDKLINKYHEVNNGDNIFLFLFLIIYIDKDNKLKIKLSSFLDEKLIDSYRIQHHWSSKSSNSKGVIQLSGFSEELIENIGNINKEKALIFLNRIK